MRKIVSFFEKEPGTKRVRIYQIVVAIGLLLASIVALVVCLALCCGFLFGFFCGTIYLATWLFDGILKTEAIIFSLKLSALLTAIVFVLSLVSAAIHFIGQKKRGDF